MFSVLAGSIVCGLITATIGAWKDVRWEKFNLLTYFRSPIVCALWAFVLTHPILPFGGSHWIVLSLASIALERVSVEVWKGLFRRMPSKFLSPEHDTQWLRHRLTSKKKE